MSQKPLFELDLTTESFTKIVRDMDYEDEIVYAIMICIARQKGYPTNRKTRKEVEGLFKEISVFRSQLMASNRTNPFWQALQRNVPAGNKQGKGGKKTAQ
jgi:hypothetical protein